MKRKQQGRKAVAYTTPMTAQPVTVLPAGDEWLYELKLDGYRALILKNASRIQIRSRNDKELTRNYPKLAAAALRIKAEIAVIDGEIVALGPDGKPSFQALQHRGSSPEYQIVFYAFDVLHADGRDVTGEPLLKRRARLQALFGEGSAIRLSEELPGSAADAVTVVRTAGLEGVIAKRKNSIYEPGERSGDWVKLKLDQQQEFVIGGYRANGAQSTAGSGRPSRRKSLQPDIGHRRSS